MSEIGERLDLRNLPPVEPVEPPTRWSMTLLNHGNACRRSAYLYVKHHGGQPAYELDFGTALHLFCEQVMNDLIERGERNLYAAAAGEDPQLAKRAVASMTAAIVNEILQAHPELTLPVARPVSHDGQPTRTTVDDLRQCAYHFAVGCDIDPQKVVGVERKFVLDLPGGRTVSGKLDVAVIDGLYAEVTDYKSTFNLPPQDAIDDAFQLKLYSALLLFGQPVEKVGEEEIRLPGLGGGIDEVRAREVYPRYLRDDGLMQERATTFGRQELLDWLFDLGLLVEDLAERFATWDFPAVSGSHCTRCPCRPECPLPPGLRQNAGTINSYAEAQQAAEWLVQTKAEVGATQKELRNWADANGGIVRFGKDLIFEFVPREARETDWASLEESLSAGEPARLEQFVRVRPSTEFRKRKLTATELAEEAGGAGEAPESTDQEEQADEHGDVERARDERFGVEAPF